MRIGLLSDIHANAHGLEAVLKSAKKKKVEKLICCGDYVGYYFEPDRVMSLMSDWDWVGISGNHELMLSDWLKGKNQKQIRCKYGSGVSIAANKLSNEVSSQLCQMPKVLKLNILNYKLLLCHGSPWDGDAYIYPDAPKEVVNRMFSHNYDFDILLFGHTHYPVKWEQDKKIIINPGSVGQPRDYNPSSSWVLWDTVDNSFNFYREKYEVNAVVEMCERFNPEISYLKDVLVRE